MATKLVKFKNNITRGDTPLVSVPITVGGVAADLTGYVLTLTITSNANPQPSDTPEIQITVNGDETGIANFQLLNDQANNSTKDLVPSTTYNYDIQLFNGQSGVLKRIMTIVKGTLDVDIDYNRSES